MSLYLARHGQAFPAGLDPNRALTGEGKREVEYIARLAKDSGVSISRILHSGKTRARETAEIIADYLQPSLGVKEIDGINPNDDVKKIVPGLGQANNVMLVGHLPFLEKLVSYLVMGSTDKAVIAFQPGGIVCMNQEALDRSWYIKWALMPDMA